MPVHMIKPKTKNKELLKLSFKFWKILKCFIKYSDNYTEPEKTV